MWLLNWLLGRAAKLLEWFGSSYSSWVLKLKNFYYWLKYYRDQAFKWSKDWALPKILSYYYTARVFIAYKYNQAINWTNQKADEISIFLSGKIQGTKDLIKVITNEFRNKDTWLTNLVFREDNKTETGLKTWTERFVDNLLNPFSWIIDFKDLIIELQELFTTENKTRFLTLINDLFGFLLNLAVHPLKTLIGIIQPVFLELLSYSVAYALGSEEYELPDWPDWSLWGGGGNGGDLPPGVKHDLVSPLIKLRISGYTFNNPPGHRALDLGLLNGDPVFAMHSGTIEYINRSFIGYGYQITMGGGFWWTRYAHLNKILVSPGQHVSKGQKIGHGDDTGNSTGPHLHLEIKYKGSFVDPAKILF